ncbi:MAG: heavy-metal-associated domain-containing protein [Gemmatimonadota bacterium]
MARYDLEVEGMTCEHCAEKVRRALVGVEGVREAKVSLDEGRAQVRTSGPTTIDALAEAVREAGYGARPARRERPGRSEDDRPVAGRHLLILGGGSGVRGGRSVGPSRSACSVVGFRRWRISRPRKRVIPFLIAEAPVSLFSCPEPLSYPKEKKASRSEAS